MEPRLWISLPDRTHDNYGVQIYHPRDQNLIERAEELFNQYFMWNENQRKFGTFFQGGHGCNDWRYFEFWLPTDNIEIQDMILEASILIADELGMELEIGRV